MAWRRFFFFEDDVRRVLSVDRGIMDSVHKSVENFDLASTSVPKEFHLFDDAGMAEWFGDEDCGVPAAKKRKVMNDVTSRFANKVTSDSELKEISRGLCRTTQSRIPFGACVVSIDTNCT